MSVPMMQQPVQSLMFERLMQQMGVPYGDGFTACRKLVALVEHVAPAMNEIDRLQLGRLMVSTGHEIGLSCRRRD